MYRNVKHSSWLSIDAIAVLLLDFYYSMPRPKTIAHRKAHRKAGRLAES